MLFFTYLSVKDGVEQVGCTREASVRGERDLVQEAGRHHRSEGEVGERPFELFGHPLQLPLMYRCAQERARDDAAGQHVDLAREVYRVAAARYLAPARHLVLDALQ